MNVVKPDKPRGFATVECLLCKSVQARLLRCARRLARASGDEAVRAQAEARVRAIAAVVRLLLAYNVARCCAALEGYLMVEMEKPVRRPERARAWRCGQYVAPAVSVQLRTVLVTLDGRLVVEMEKPEVRGLAKCARMRAVMAVVCLL